MKHLPWRWLISIGLSIAVIFLVIAEREQIGHALTSLQTARIDLLAWALLLSLLSFFLTSLIYTIALRSLGYRQIGFVRIYAVTIVALILSQTIPAGGVASYAVLTEAVRRRGVPPGHAALLASLEAIIYVVALLIFFGFGVAYVVARSGIGAAEQSSLLAGIVPILLVGGAGVLITRDQFTLHRWFLGAKNRLARVLRREWSDAPVEKVVEDLVRGRALIAERPLALTGMLVVELLALFGHSVVMLLVIMSLGGSANLLWVVAAFGIVMATSTFNVLPGGGGTVEAVLAITLQGFGVGQVAIVAAVVFRLINFWLMLPIAAVCYWWIMRQPSHPSDHLDVAA